jgi:hypothetical protein
VVFQEEEKGTFMENKLQMKGNIKLRASHINGETAAHQTEVVREYSIHMPWRMRSSLADEI